MLQSVAELLPFLKDSVVVFDRQQRPVFLIPHRWRVFSWPPPPPPLLLWQLTALPGKSNLISSLLFLVLLFYFFHLCVFSSYTTRSEYFPHSCLYWIRSLIFIQSGATQLEAAINVHLFNCTINCDRIQRHRCSINLLEQLKGLSPSGGASDFLFERLAAVAFSALISPVRVST